MVKESTKDFPEDDDGNRYYRDRANYAPVLIAIYTSMTCCSCLWMILAIVGGVEEEWELMIVSLCFWFFFTSCAMTFFVMWFFRYTKKRLLFESAENELVISTTYGLLPCITKHLAIDYDQINDFLIIPTFMTNCCPDPLKRYRIHCETLSMQMFVVATDNVLPHQKKLVKICRKQPGLTKLGEIDRVLRKNKLVMKQRKNALKERSRLEKLRDERRVERLKRKEERIKKLKSGGTDTNSAANNWRRLRDHKQLNSKYGRIL